MVSASPLVPAPVETNETPLPPRPSCVPVKSPAVPVDSVTPMPTVPPEATVPEALLTVSVAGAVPS